MRDSKITIIFAVKVITIPTDVTILTFKEERKIYGQM